MPNLVPFDEKVRGLPAVPDDAQGRIIFGMDATASRSLMWKAAKAEQGKMFHSVGGVSMKLIYFRGMALDYSIECTESDWVTDPAKLKALMDKVECRAGETQIEEVLRRAGAENKKHRVAALMYVGDACEERREAGEAYELAERAILALGGHE